MFSSCMLRISVQNRPMTGPSFDIIQHTEQLTQKWGGDANSILTVHLPPAKQNRDAISIHLDLKDWIDLSKARLQRADGTKFQAAYEYLNSNVADGTIRVLLSGALYMEIALRIPDVRRRTHLADVMSEISRFNALNARHVLLEAEIEGALHRRLGRPAFPRKVQPFGRGGFFPFTGKVHAMTFDDDRSGIIEQLIQKDPVNTPWCHRVSAPPRMIPYRPPS